MLAAFGYRDFRVQWIGACSSAIGTWMQIIAQNWLVLSLTNSPFFLGLDAFLQELPIIMFTLIGRSEEHTSELQSHSDLVCRLLLEKKKEYIDIRYTRPMNS